MPSSAALGGSRTIVVPELERQTLRVRGADAKSWLNGVLSCDVARLSPTQGAYGLLLNKQGKIQAELDLIQTGDSVLLGVSAGRGELVQGQLDRVLVMEDAELEAEPELRWLRFHGPDAAQGARAVTRAVASGEIDWLGVGGAALVVREADVDGALDAAGAAGIERAGPERWNAFRIRRGFPSYGSDFSDEDNPHEASLERRAVSWTKGCYLGQEVVCMQDMRGRVKRRLVPLEFDGVEPIAAGSDVAADGETGPVGRILSSASDGVATIALARLKFPFFEGKHALAVAGRSARILTPTAPGDGSFQT